MRSLFLSLNSNIKTILVFSLGLLLLLFNNTIAQDDAAVAFDTVPVGDEIFENTTAGEFTPGKGFMVFKSGIASVNLSVYGLARYINQIDEDNMFLDHLDREKPIDTRQDIMWHRTFLWVSGHFFTSKLRYTISVWGLVSTNQVLVFGNLQFALMKEITFGVGIGPNLGCRSMLGPWPYFLSSNGRCNHDSARPPFLLKLL